MRVFLGTNVLVAAFATRGLCADVVRTVLAEHELVVSETVLNELTRALKAKIGLPEADVRRILSFLRQHGRVVAGLRAGTAVAVRGPDDAMVLGEAVASGADVLVTGDRDLLEIEVPPPQPRIVDPRGFWTMVAAAGSV